MNPLNLLRLISFAALFLSAKTFAVSGTDTGTVQVTGRMIPSTCLINGNSGGTTNILVDLGNVTTVAFSTAGSAGASVLPTLTLTGCPFSSPIKFSLDGSGSIDSTYLAYKNSIAVGAGGASNIGAQVINTGTNTPINPNGANDVTVTSDGAGAATMPIAIRFISLGGATAGTFSTVAGFNITYP